jgi:uncharacterized cupredoxin-like copper-binding protein
MDPYFRSVPAFAALVIGLISLAILSVAAIACGSSGSTDQDEKSATGAAEAMTEATGETVVVEASEFKFAPSTIRIPAGKPVKVVLNNGGKLEHEILIRDLSVKIVATETSHDMHSAGEAGMRAMSEHVKAGRFHVHAGPGGEASEVMQADAAGTYDFACEIPGHKEAGMVGRIEVQP